MPAKSNGQMNPRPTLWIWAIALGVLASQVAKGRLTALDQQIAHWAAAIRSPWLDGSMQTVTFFGSSTWTTVGLVGLAWWHIRSGRTHTVLTMTGAFLVGLLTEVILRLSIAQWRPDVLAIPASMDLITRFQVAGFPSGHAFRSAFVFGWLARAVRHASRSWALLGRILCWVMIGLVGLSRVSLNRHWASDVFGSWLLVLVVFAIARMWERSR